MFKNEIELAITVSSLKKEGCILNEQSLELIAKKINAIESLKSHIKMGDFLNECGVKKDLYGHISTLNYMAESLKTNYFNSRQKLLHNILLYYSCKKNKKILFNIICKSTHPLLFKANKNEAGKFKESLNKILEYSSYRIGNNKIEKLKEKTSKIKVATFEKNGIGYLKVDKKNIEVGNAETAKYQLLKSFCNPIGTARTLEYLFEKIKRFTKKNASDEADEYLKKNYKKLKIEGTIKELQRLLSAHDVNKKFKFKIDSDKAWLSYR
ncbi:MAG TPA: hypothetical protein P5548_01495 [Candidatus Moranbacteria bacterium]|nr:hypothetical protein [Candidatus Moranbacteria bacterium]HRZ33564.1 hypothetical protein [Candidatus Moranbacteria bacterium]